MMTIKAWPGYREGVVRQAFISLCLVLLCVFGPVRGGMADEAAPLAADPVAERRLQALSAELRCLVCQNQTIADSNADLAQDLRREIRGMIQAGQSDQQIIEFMVTRYGDFVLYRPPFKSATLLLWLGPLALLLAGMFFLHRYLRRRASVLLAAQPLSAEESRRADALLEPKTPDIP